MGGGFVTPNFCWVDSEIFEWFQDSWIDSCNSCLPNKGLYITWLIINYTEMYYIIVRIIILDSRICTWFSDSTSESKWFLEPSTWFRIFADRLVGLSQLWRHNFSHNRGCKAKSICQYNRRNLQHNRGRNRYPCINWCLNMN